ncbi:MAG: DUF1446 domain-containing protein [Planctomycetota bacterium]|nr:MAG: DUF1446 domain-containing protein [Planctomycetota bacterium]REJ96829.1 MAG: DUF1446 domain-containing protein [Planctomycetota bacterium]
MAVTLRIANAAGFLGDNIDAPRRLVEAAEVDYLTLEYLAELTLSIMARQRQKNPQLGFAGDLINVARSLTPALAAQEELHLVTNGGGLNPPAAAAAVGQVLVEAKLGHVPIGVVTGDDLAERIDELKAAGCPLTNLDTGEPIAKLEAPIVSANAYLGAAPIVEALAADARVVLTGRVADAALCLGPAAHEYGWSWDDWNTLAAGSVAGHVIECGAQATGGYATEWGSCDLTDPGYPIAEIKRDGSCVITKPAGSGGVVNRRTVSEQLVYEIGDPTCYATPDVVVDFTTVELAEVGDDRVQLTGARGQAAPDDYKVSLAYADGYTAAGQLVVYGRDCVDKAAAAADIVFARLAHAGVQFAATHRELLGTGDGVPGLHGEADDARQDIREVVLRLAVRDPRRAAVERFAKELAPLITGGPAGIAGYAQGRPQVRPVFAYWPTLVPKSAVEPRVDVRPAADWTT